MAHDESLLKITSLILRCASSGVMKKVVFSKPSDKTIIKTVLSPKQISGALALQSEFFHKDNKVTHKNFALDTLTIELLEDFAKDYMQINLITSLGDAEYKCSSSGRSVVLGDKKIEKALSSLTPSAESENCALSENNRKKKYILSGSEPFLRELEVSDVNGRVYDKKQAKFRQINRFLEIIRDAEDKLPTSQIRICDLCCGKSYLSFAAYHYFANVKKMKVSMTGVDLKPDVVERCNAVARAVGFDGLEFVCMDVNDYDPEERPSLVISLHACDIATDIVLCKAASWGTNVILSTPCCHHELNHSIDCKELSFITEHSMLRQKLCDAATDALRLCRLEAEGYMTSTVELIDPNDTPKNVMLRAYRKKNFDKNSREAAQALERYLAAKRFLCGDKDTSVYHF